MNAGPANGSDPDRVAVLARRVYFPGRDGFDGGYNMFSTPDLLVILAVALVVFGAGKASDLGKALGKGIQDFNRVKDAGEKMMKDPLKEVQNLPQLFDSSPETGPKTAPPAPSKTETT
jgi:sec-independent protein translocase protein TatA